MLVLFLSLNKKITLKQITLEQIIWRTHLHMIINMIAKQNTVWHMKGNDVLGGSHRILTPNGKRSSRPGLATEVPPDVQKMLDIKYGIKISHLSL